MKFNGSYSIEFNLVCTGHVIELSTNVNLTKEIPINNKSVIIGTLPVGYRPASRLIVKPNMTGCIPQIIIDTDGTITIANGKDYSNNDCNYPASWFRLEIVYIAS